MIIVVMLVLGVPLFLAFLPLFIASARHRRLMAMYTRWIVRWAVPGMLIRLTPPPPVVSIVVQGDTDMMNQQVTSFKITHSHGQTETGIDTYEEAVAKVREVYGADCEIGHSGDITDGGQKTYVWQDAETAENDDGSRACCSIRKVYTE